MRDEELCRALRGGEPPLDEAHRARLERQLLAAYDARVPRPAPHRPPWFRYATAVGFLLCLMVATQVPAGYRVEVGKRVTLTLPSGDFPPEERVQRVVRTLGAGQGGDVRVQLHHTPAGTNVLVVDLWGDRLLPDAALVERLHALPELAGAEVSVTSLQGRVRDTLLGLMEHLLLQRHASPGELEQARQQVLEALRRREGHDAEVDVQVDTGTERPRVRVKVRRGEGRQGEGAHTPAE